MTRASALVVLYLITAVLFLGLDLVWIQAVVKPVFEADVPNLMAEEIKLAPAAVFYLLYIVGILYFASAAGLDPGAKSMVRVACDGALFGLFCYGTYAVTNYAILEGWTVRMALLDLAWGTLFTGAMAVAGLWPTRRLFGRSLRPAGA